MTLPNVLFIGPDKAGSTWLAETLASHPQVFIPAAKDIYFFDRHHARGLAWYERWFARAGQEPVVAEICHDYLFSPEACARIAQQLPDVRLLTILRRPSERAFSSYLHMRKHGRAQLSFEEAIATIDELVDHGRYATHLRPYIDTFGRDRLWVGLFDDLHRDPQGMADRLFAWLGVEDIALPEDLHISRLAASRPRWPGIARLVKGGAVVTRRLGQPGVVGRVKRRPWVQRALYRRYSDDKPIANASTLEAIDQQLAGEIRDLAELIGLDVAGAWLDSPAVAPAD